MAEQPLLVIGVLHQDFAAYSRDLAPEEKIEWEKIRGRFEDILFDEPADQLLRLLARAIDSSGPPKVVESDWVRAFRTTVETGQVPLGIPESEAEALLRRCWPLHPLTAIVLGPVFKRYGQNERSAFTFCQSREPFGLRDFESRSVSQMYLVSHLFEYLISTYGDGLVANRDGKKWAEALDIERRLTDFEPQRLHAFRATALLSIVGRWSELAATPELVAASLAPEFAQDVVEDAIQSLRQKSHLVLRKFNNTLALWEGSDVDVEARLSLARASMPRHLATAGQVAKHIGMRPLIARRHSYETGTLRVFPVTFEDSFNSAGNGRAVGRSDGRVVVVLPPDGADSAAQSHQSDDPATLHVAPANHREIRSLALELACIDWVRRNTPEIAGDATARRELDAREGEVRRRLADEQVEMLFGEANDHSAQWYRFGKKVRVSDARELNDLLSSACDDLYPSAPVIRNEIINRSELSSSAAAARRNLIHAMIERPDAEGLGIAGNPPERSIYLSVLRELGLHRAARNGSWTFTSDAARARNNAGEMLRGIYEFLKGSEAERRSVADLFALLQAPPFGIRAGVLPIILCAVLISLESEVALYEDGAFVSQLSVEAFERLMKTPGCFSLRRWAVSGVRASIFRQMTWMVSDAAAIAGERTQVLAVVKPLLKFYRRLDAYSQNSRGLSGLAISVRSALANATEPDQLLFTELPIACGIEAFQSGSRGRETDVAKYVTRLRDAIEELQRAYESLLQSAVQANAEAFCLGGDLATVRARLTGRAREIEFVAVDPEIKNFVRRVVDQTIDDRQWIESIASLLVGKPAPVWSDDDRAKFDVVLASRVRRFQSLEAMVRKGGAALERGDQIVRVAVAGSRLRDHEIVVHLSNDQAAQITSLAGRIRALLGSNGERRHRNVVLASLATLIEETADDGVAVTTTGGRE